MKAAASAAVVFASVQFCPAPFAAIPVVVEIELGSTAAWVGAIGGVVGGASAAASAVKGAHGGNQNGDVQDASPYSGIKRQDDSNKLA
ncbi:hypothetical protein UCRPC4_g00845 [Phaeomoniella chlamydospora]|uniref:Uncharacterized protein n=1 Tax=Phaeomoniella chlamydospora TaxID=158046 RepID=A0A0G2HHI1_PHACM|nr:hypothetical protein UCRPC4_g00845 [Phaeomoniella chlamydospora]